MSLFQYYRSFQQSKASTEPVLTFEDLSIDSDLTDLQRFLKYVKSSIGLQRLSQVKLISTIVEDIGFSETKTTILPLIETISKDSEPVIRQHLIEQFSSLTKVCINHNSDEGYKCFIDTILSCVIRLLLDESTEVRHAAKDCYLSLLPYIRKDQVGEMLLSSTLRLGHDDDNNENARIIAIEILLSSVNYLDIDLIENFVLSEIVSLTDDPSLRIRKCLVQYLPHIFKYISIQKMYDILLPSLKTLCQDTMYRVRLACIPSIIDISFLVHESIRITHLFPIYQSLLHDSSNEVQITAMKHIGKFIASLPTDSIDTSLLNKYYSLLYDDTTTTTTAAVDLDADTIIAAALLVTDNGETNTDIDNNKDDGKEKEEDVKEEKEDKERDDVDYVYSCAYAFPGVCKALGPTRWNELRKLYQDLCHSKHGKVKETLASSLHEIAAILKEETVVEEELVPIFDDFLQESEQIQELLLHHLSSFLQYLSYPCRISYMTLIHNILHSSNPFNWRLRYCIARQLPTMIHLTEKNTVTDILFPLMMTLLQDPVAVVRQQSYIGITTLLSFLCHDISLISETATSTITTTTTTTEENSALITDQVNNIVTSINAFITHDSYQFRQLWIDLCYYFLKYLPQHIIESYFIEGIVVLSHDPVSNVRISLAKLLTGWCKNTTATTTSSTEEKDSDVSLLSEIPDITAIYLKENSNWTWLLYTDDIKQVVMTLSCDEKDVYDYMVLLESVYPEITFSMVNHKNGTKDLSTRHHKDRVMIGEKEEDTNAYNDEEEEQRRKEKEQLRLSNGELYIRKSIDGSMLSQIAHLTPPSSPSHGTLSSPGHSLDLSSSSSADMPNIDGLPEDMYQLDVHHQLAPTPPPL